jgi:hypothetical protein
MERRRYSRVGAPAIVMVIGDREYETVNWSLGGCVLSDYDGELTPGALFDIDGIAAAGEKPIDVEIRARVLRRNRDTGELALSFHDVDRRAYALMQELMADRGTPVEEPSEPSEGSNDG